MMKKKENKFCNKILFHEYKYNKKLYFIDFFEIFLKTLSKKT